MRSYDELLDENQYLKSLLAKIINKQHSPENHQAILTKKSHINEKIQLLKTLFQARQDTYAVRWELENGSKSGYSPACAIEWQQPYCKKPAISCRSCQNRKLLPLTDQVWFHHLEGKHTIGIYPLLKNNTCSFLAVDFDKGNWQQEVLAFAATCASCNIPYHIERSRSGEGAHVWIFFSTNISAKLARELGNFLIAKTKENNNEILLNSYDRMFPNQEQLHEDGFGNLIALPLQRNPAREGNSLFIDDNFQPHPDQWLYLSSIKKVTFEEIQHLLSDQSANEIILTLKDGIHISKKGISIEMLKELSNIASFSNPAYYKAQAKRQSTYGLPKTINCAMDNPSANSLVLPKGCLREILQCLTKYQLEVIIQDQQYLGEGLAVSFQGELTTQQSDAVTALLKEPNGTLSATTGFGKTVVGAAMIAERRRNTLIIVHRNQLLKQWVERLSQFLDLDPKEIGQIGGGKNKITGKIDVATIQSLNYGGQLKSFVTQYGQVIVDECHILSAVTFEKVMKKIRPKYVLGLTATPKRKDGWHPIITMQCGPIRYTVDGKKQAKVRPFLQTLKPRNTTFFSKKSAIQDIYEELIKNDARNHHILDDVLQALDQGRYPIILTERIEHVRILEKQFRGFVKNLIVVTGSLKKKDQKRELERLKHLPIQEERLIIATGKYMGKDLTSLFLIPCF